ncbi:hypothetical protein M8C21_015970 [Ambrosia artemisiifolia]|uniref:DIRP domain-containing protein n=1 Tax=Ambrosia artemisiifolia TaxID=4212 RepID=A0AAD5D191_AMBAR|nr:hypothetical protein M8C21_015970 [Ambrosia artemisiifolia]
MFSVWVNEIAEDKVPFPVDNDSDVNKEDNGDEDSSESDEESMSEDQRSEDQDVGDSETVLPINAPASVNVEINAPSQDCDNQGGYNVEDFSTPIISEVTIDQVKGNNKRKKNKGLKPLGLDSGSYTSSNDRPTKESRLEEDDPFGLAPIILGRNITFRRSGPDPTDASLDPLFGDLEKQTTLSSSSVDLGNAVARETVCPSPGNKLEEEIAVRNSIIDEGLQSELPDLKEDKPPIGSTAHQRHKIKVPADTERAKPGRESKVDYKALATGKQLDRSTNKSAKRKNKFFEAFINEEGKCVNKVTGANEGYAPSKICKSAKLVEYSSSNSNTSRTGAADSAISTALLPTCDGVDLPSKRQNKRKVNPNRIANHGEMNLIKVNSKEQPNKQMEPKEASCDLKDKAFGYLSSSMVRRWATYEWFYSAIDYPWFAKREFVEYLDHVGLGHIPRLTKVEWGVIRSSLGKPRRFSRNFLREEREKLWQYRESVRKHYTELRSGTREGLPTDLARPLAVGQRVVALHPESREVHDGSVLTVDHDKCRIQFDRPELGVAFVKDIDCMPLNLWDNMPEALRRENSALYGYFMNSGEPRLPQSVTASLMLHTSSEQSPPIAMMNQRLVHNGSGTPAFSQHAAYAPSVSQIQSRETDIRALSELTRALDKKEAILTELKLVNDGLMRHKNETGTEMKVSESFKKEYAMVTSALLNLRQRNTHPGNCLPPWQKLQPSSVGIVGPMSSVDNFPSNNQLASNVVKIMNSSRLEAQKLVHPAMQALSKIKVEQSVPSTVAAVFESLGATKNPTGYGSTTFKPSEQGNGVVASKHTPDPSQALDSKLRGDSETTILSDLIVSCVATYHMIQMCSERQYPPGDVVEMLDSAFTKLRPQCPENLGIYREIEMCMGRVKTQILALVPS